MVDCLCRQNGIITLNGVCLNATKIASYINPRHESYLKIMLQVGLRQSFEVEKGTRIPTTIGDSFEALLRLHMQNTTTT